jgi:HAD superfamily hydrolase (TIGR01490 family)
VTLALFDLDHTLIADDSDVLWGQFLGEHHYVDPHEHERENQRYVDDYKRGTLDIYEFLGFQLSVLARHPMATLLAWRERFIEEKIRPVLLPKAAALIESHRARGHTLVIITATNRFITEPIAGLYGVPNLIAVEPELGDGRYTGWVAGVPSFAAGKVTRLEAWLAGRGEAMAESWFYSDSRNDLPLLSKVTHPIAVDPDEVLAAEARTRGWPILSLR